MLLKIFHPSFRSKYKEKKCNTLDCARWYIDFARVEVKGLFRAGEPRERKQDLAYARPSLRILPREGRRRIFDLESRWKSTSLGIRAHGNWEHDRISRIYFVSFHKARKGTGTDTPAYPGDVPTS